MTIVRNGNQPGTDLIWDMPDDAVELAQSSETIVPDRRWLIIYLGVMFALALVALVWGAIWLATNQAEALATCQLRHSTDVCQIALNG
ncbi:hypothetical protein GCM10007913_11550 [Devosia yakushimensis]|uniref:Uncharacterized protein n=1 Tax=Devosia yakushimensis TaxID=470028 RepID=A0ABQ5UC67_9HYPH|nr:hypothetical protein [Devosia yakushimensis]GLQ09223.1 hypothetical protein GCM10007913_11550 [Devosia yakushimensis]